MRHFTRKTNPFYPRKGITWPMRNFAKFSIRQIRKLANGSLCLYSVYIMRRVCGQVTYWSTDTFGQLTHLANWRIGKVKNCESNGLAHVTYWLSDASTKWLKWSGVSGGRGHWRSDGSKWRSSFKVTRTRSK